jgi:hypothetical protein
MTWRGGTHGSPTNPLLSVHSTLCVSEAALEKSSAPPATRTLCLLFME